MIKIGGLVMGVRFIFLPKLILSKSTKGIIIQVIKVIKNARGRKRKLILKRFSKSNLTNLETLYQQVFAQLLFDSPA